MNLSQPIRRVRPLAAALARSLGWTPTSYFMLSAFFVLCFIIGVVWWPLVVANLAIIDWTQPLWLEFVRKMDWLLLFDFVVMTLLIMARADLRSDALIVGVGFAGGLVIESWGTQTHLWNYFTLERPPLWIIPAWPIASLAIDRLFRFLTHLTGRVRAVPLRVTTAVYWLVFVGFYGLMLVFVRPTFDKSLTVAALVLCGLLIVTPPDKQAALLTFAAGAGLGYFLELWGTTRQCWTYYTFETPPLFAVLAHGMAAVAFWRVALLFRQVGGRLAARLRPAA